MNRAALSETSTISAPTADLLRDSSPIMTNISGSSSFPRKRESRAPALRRLLWTPACALGYAHFMSIWDGRENGISLSAAGGGEGRGEVGDSREFAEAHLTFPRLRRGPLPLPPEGRRGIAHQPREMCACPCACVAATGNTSKYRPSFNLGSSRSFGRLRSIRVCAIRCSRDRRCRCSRDRRLRRCSSGSPLYSAARRCRVSCSACRCFR
jgi:hypothetical protein